MSLIVCQSGVVTSDGFVFSPKKVINAKYVIRLATINNPKAIFKKQEQKDLRLIHV